MHHRSKLRATPLGLLSPDMRDYSANPSPGANATDEAIGKCAALRIIQAFEKIFGGAETLFGEAGIAHPEGSLKKFLGALSNDDRARISAIAFMHLMLLDTLRTGGPPERPNDWRVVRYVLFGGRNLRESILRGAECLDAIESRCGGITLRVEGDVAIISLKANAASGAASSCLLQLFRLAALHGLLNALIAQPIGLLKLSLGAERGEYESLGLPPLPFPVSTQQRAPGFSFAASVLDQPVMRTIEEADARHPLARSFLFGSSRQKNDPATTAAMVRRLVLQSLRNHERLPSLDEVATVFGGSPATLRRRLAGAGTSFRGIRDACRAELAPDLLSNSRLSIEAVAVHLDFSDSDAFRRAFRIWFGIAPSAFRQGLLGSS